MMNPPMMSALCKAVKPSDVFGRLSKEYSVVMKVFFV